MGINNPEVLGHQHQNLEVLNNLSEVANKLAYKGIVLGSSGSSVGGLQVNSLPYSWDANFGYEYKLDELTFSSLTVLFKISSNFPVRVRLYQSSEVRQKDLFRPPSVDEFQHQGIYLDVLLDENLILSPVALLAGNETAFLTLEKLLPDAGTINLMFEYIG